MIELNIEERRDRAVAYFKEGYNCAQSVFMAYSDLYDIDPEFAKKISASFGAGMGQLREVCGAASAMFMILGLQYPSINPIDKEAKIKNYTAVQRTGNAFKQKYGSMICADLLKIKRLPQTPSPSDRNAEYYEKRPCAGYVAQAAEILGRELQQKL